MPGIWRRAVFSVLITYGPFLENGVNTSPGNLAFDRSLRQRHPDWGIRGRGDVEREAARAWLRLDARYGMPGVNLLLTWVSDH